MQSNNKLLTQKYVFLSIFSYSDPFINYCLIKRAINSFKIEVSEEMQTLALQSVQLLKDI